jgi:hypothetical protein
MNFRFSNLKICFVCTDYYKISSANATMAIIPILDSVRSAYPSQCQVIDLIRATWKVNEVTPQINATSSSEMTINSTSMFWSYIVNGQNGAGSTAAVLKQLISSESDDTGTCTIDMYSNASIINFLRLFMDNISTVGKYRRESYEVMKSLSKMINSSNKVDASSDHTILVMTKNILATFLSTNPRSLLSSDMVDAKRVIEQVVQLQQVGDNTNSDGQSLHRNLLAEIIQSDKGRFSIPVLDLIADDTGCETILDNIELQNALFHAVTYDGINNTHFQKLTHLFEICLQKVKSVIQCDVKDAKYLESLTSLMCALSSQEHLILLNQTNSFSKVVKELLKEDIQTKIRSISKRAQYSILFLIYQCNQCDVPDVSSINAMLILRLSHLFSQTLKAAIKTTCIDPEVNPIDLLNLLVKLVDQSTPIDHEYLASFECAWIGDMIRPCLKYGIGSGKGFTPNGQRLCIRTVKQLLDMMSDSGQKYGVNVTLDFKTVAKQVFEMITTHSKINDVLLDIEGDLSLIKVELITLLHSCIVQWDSTKNFDETIWRMLLSAYNAGMSQSDELLREIILTYGKLANEVCCSFVTCSQTFYFSS